MKTRKIIFFNETDEPVDNWGGVSRISKPWVEIFPDGEFHLEVPRITSEDEVILVGTCDTALTSSIFLAGAMEIASMRPASLKVFISYFRHARSDRQFLNHSPDIASAVVGAKFEARQWSQLGVIYPGVQITCLCLHNDSIVNFFEGSVRVKNLGRGVFEDLTWSHGIRQWFHERDDLVLASVDEGRRFEVTKLGQIYRTETAFITKLRISATETHILEVVGDVAGKNVVIVDDMISTGGSMIEAARAYRARGAKTVYGVAVHGLFVGSDARLDELTSVLDGIVVTNSHPGAMAAQKKKPDRIRVVNVLVPHQILAWV